MGIITGIILILIVSLYHSINKWVQKNGSVMARMKIELSFDELKNLGVYEICKKSESLALNSLGALQTKQQVTPSNPLYAIIRTYRRLKQGY